MENLLQTKVSQIYLFALIPKWMIQEWWHADQFSQVDRYCTVARKERKAQPGARATDICRKECGYFQYGTCGEKPRASEMSHQLESSDESSDTQTGLSNHGLQACMNIDTCNGTWLCGCGSDSLTDSISCVVISIIRKLVMESSQTDTATALPKRGHSPLQQHNTKPAKSIPRLTRPLGIEIIEYHSFTANKSKPHIHYPTDLNLKRLPKSSNQFAYKYLNFLVHVWICNENSE